MHLVIWMLRTSGFPEHATCLSSVGLVSTAMNQVLPCSLSNGWHHLHLDLHASSADSCLADGIRHFELAIKKSIVSCQACIPVTLLTRLFHWLWPMESKSLTRNCTRSQPATFVKFLGVFGFWKGKLGITNHFSRSGTMEFTKTLWHVCWFASLEVFWSVFCCPLWPKEAHWDLDDSHACDLWTNIWNFPV